MAVVIRWLAPLLGSMDSDKREGSNQLFMAVVTNVVKLTPMSTTCYYRGWGGAGREVTHDKSGDECAFKKGGKGVF